MSSLIAGSTALRLVPELQPSPVPDPAAAPLPDLRNLPSAALAWLDDTDDTADVLESWARAQALERYLARRGWSTRPVQVVDRFHEMKIGEMLGPSWARSSLTKELSKNERSQFRLMAEHRDKVLAYCSENGDSTIPNPSRRAVVQRIEQAVAGETAESVSIGTADLRLGDFRDVLEDVTDAALVFTDPPYPTEFLPLWEPLAEMATRWLQPGRLLVAYCGQYILHQVLNRVTNHLDYWWIVAQVHGGGAFNKVFSRRAIVGWKPMLMFRNGEGPEPAWFKDIVKGQREKDDTGGGFPTGGGPAPHNYAAWGQAETEAAHFIEALTEPGDLVVDPFCGGGTTAAAAVKLGRRVITCDVDSEAIAHTRQRIETAIR